MDLQYDAEKRRRTLLERGLDFEDAPRIFAGLTLTDTDDRRDYGEIRYLTIGILTDAVVVIVWTERGDATRIISMRKAHDSEREKYWRELDRSR